MERRQISAAGIFPTKVAEYEKEYLHTNKNVVGISADSTCDSGEERRGRLRGRPHHWDGGLNEV